jgi:hypothetical protein
LFREKAEQAEQAARAELVWPEYLKWATEAKETAVEARERLGRAALEEQAAQASSELPECRGLESEDSSSAKVGSHSSSFMPKAPVVRAG